jgi:hypothetical protein
LNELEQVCRANYLDCQAERRSSSSPGWPAVAGCRFSQYVDVAKRLGSEHWMPIVAMADSGLLSGRHDLSIEVFRAPIGPAYIKSTSGSAVSL